MLRRAELQDLEILLELALKLWPHIDADFLRDDFIFTLTDPDAVFFIANEEDMDIGFSQGQLRREYVEGTHTSPVGYLEAIYVREGYRGKGVATALVRACEDWAREFGCTEFGSDCELKNTTSFLFHTSIGFTEANRNIHFVKKL